MPVCTLLLESFSTILNLDVFNNLLILDVSSGRERLSDQLVLWILTFLRVSSLLLLQIEEFRDLDINHIWVVCFKVENI